MSDISSEPDPDRTIKGLCIAWLVCAFLLAIGFGIVLGPGGVFIGVGLAGLSVVAPAVISYDFLERKS